jgi:hypothetical protein
VTGAGYRALVTRIRTMAMVLALALLTAACGGGDDDEELDSEGQAPATTAAPTTVPVATTAGVTGPATNLTLRITDVRLFNSEESDNGMRVLLPAGVTTASVTLTGVPSPNQVVSVCQARELERRLTGATCRTPASGEAVNVALGSAASGVEVIQVGATGAGAAGNSTAISEVNIRYTASSREINARFPQIAAGEEGGRPSFALTPPSTDGAYRATLTWTVIAVFGGTPANAQLELVQGGNVTNQAQAGSEVRLSGTISPPATDAAIRVQNLGSAALVSPKLTVLLP